jgi:hypothetical protein
MALEQGSVTLRRFFSATPLPKSREDIWFEQLNEGRLKEREDLEPDAENGGWSVLGNELSTEFSAKNVILGPYVMFSYRRDTIKIPTGLVELHLKAQLAVEQEYGETVDRIKRQAIKDDIIQDLLSTVHPHIETAGILVDSSRQVVYFSSNSDKLTDEFLTLFYKCWNIQLVEADWESSAHRLLVEDDAFEKLCRHPRIELVDGLEIHPEFEDPLPSRLGSSFLTWFYFFLQTTESVWASEEIEECGIIVDDNLSLAGENMGSREITIKKGNVSTCRELAAAFAAGKSLSKAKFNFVRGDEEEGQLWSFNLDKKNLILQGLKVPKSEEMDRYSAMMDRFDAIAEIHDMVDDIYRDHLHMRLSEEWPEIIQDMRNWVAEMDGADGIWEESKEEKVSQDQPSDDLKSSTADSGAPVSTLMSTLSPAEERDLEYPLEQAHSASSERAATDAAEEGAKHGIEEIEENVSKDNPKDLASLAEETKEKQEIPESA